MHAAHRATRVVFVKWRVDSFFWAWEVPASLGDPMEINLADTCIMGLDPGASGAVAFYYPDFPQRVAVYDTPIIGKELNCPALLQLIQTHMPEMAVIEAVHAMPKQGVSSVWNFGVAYGMARGVIAAALVPSRLVTPTKWKKHFALDADKEKARALAVSKWPDCSHFNRKKDHGRAEAALLALYGAQTK